MHTGNEENTDKRRHYKIIRQIKQMQNKAVVLRILMIMVRLK